MKPTISTSPLTWSWTTAGINPSSFEKSIVLRSTFCVPGSGSGFRVPGSVQKKTRHLPAGLRSFGWFGVLAFQSLSARSPAGRPRGRGGNGARGADRKTSKQQAIKNGPPAARVVCFLFMRRLLVLALAVITIAAAAAAEDWPQFLGPGRNGLYNGPPLAESWGAQG